MVCCPGFCGGSWHPQPCGAYDESVKWNSVALLLWSQMERWEVCERMLAKLVFMLITNSLRTDIPLKALNLHFGVNFSLVSQVNPHINLFFFSSRGAVGRPVTHRRGRGW